LIIKNEKKIFSCSIVNIPDEKNIQQMSKLFGEPVTAKTLGTVWDKGKEVI